MGSSVTINYGNCFEVYFDDNNDLSYSRLIGGKLYTVKRHADDLLKELSTLSKCDDDEFKLICSLVKSSVEVSEPIDK